MNRIKIFNRIVRGQTLIEVLITIVMVGAVTVALIRFQSYLFYNNSIAQQKRTAELLALSKMESLRDFQTLTTTSGYSAYQDIASGSSSTSGITTTYSMTWTVTSFSNPTYKTLDITVTWPDRFGTTQTVRLITDVAGIDPQNSSAVM